MFVKGIEFVDRLIALFLVLVLWVYKSLRDRAHVFLEGQEPELDVIDLFIKSYFMVSHMLLALLASLIAPLVSVSASCAPTWR